MLPLREKSSSVRVFSDLYSGSVKQNNHEDSEAYRLRISAERTSLRGGKRVRHTLIRALVASRPDSVDRIGHIDSGCLRCQPPGVLCTASDSLCWYSMR